MFTCLMGQKIKQIQTIFVSVYSKSFTLNHLKLRKSDLNSIKYHYQEILS